MISQLMTEYFIDGRLRQEAKKSGTFYTLLKKARKEFKRRWLNTVLEHQWELETWALPLIWYRRVAKKFLEDVSNTGTL